MPSAGEYNRSLSRTPVQRLFFWLFAFLGAGSAALFRMAPLQLTTTLLGLALAAVILLLVRRDRLYLMHGLFWAIVAGAVAVLGAWPGLIDRLARWTGFGYPAALLLLLAWVVLLIKALHADMVNTRIERDVRRLNQRLALLEADCESLLEQKNASIPQAPEHVFSAASDPDSNLSSGI